MGKRNTMEDDAFFERRGKQSKTRGEWCDDDEYARRPSKSRPNRVDKRRDVSKYEVDGWTNDRSNRYR